MKAFEIKLANKTDQHGEADRKAPSNVYLDDLKESDVKVGPVPFAKHGEDKHLVQGVQPKHSLLTHPPTNGSAHVSYRLNGAYDTLKGTVAVADGAMPKGN